MSSAKRPVVLLGGGGHARVLADCLALCGRAALGFTANEPHPDLAPGVTWLGGDDILAAHAPTDVELVNAIGSTRDTTRRRELHDAFSSKSYAFATVIHPAAVVARLGTQIAAGCQILAGAVVGPHARLAENVLVNTRAVVEHDCVVGAHSHIASGAILCGGCKIGEGVHVGAGATVIQGVTLGDGVVVAAGAVVTRDVSAHTLVVGVPAKEKRTL